MYFPTVPAVSRFVSIRHLNYHLWTWEPDQTPTEPPLVLLHGWMDVGASFQFMVDALGARLRQHRRIIAPDWRGFGQTPGTGADHYVFADYLGDLDFLLDALAPEQPVDLVGHSMGGNVAMLYAGVRPERVRRLVNLEGFGMPATNPADAGPRYARWMDELRKLHSEELQLKPYPTQQAVAQRLMKTNPRLAPAKATWLAQHWADERTLSDGTRQWLIRGDAAHKIVNPTLYRVDEVLSIWGQISAPVLAVQASDNSLAQWFQGRYTLDEYHQRLKSVPRVQVAHIENAGHMLHHDQPEVLAGLLEPFLLAP